MILTPLTRAAFLGVGFRHEYTFDDLACQSYHREDAAGVAQCAVERNALPGRGLGDNQLQAARTEQDSHRDGQVIGRSLFFKVGGSQVDHDRRIGKVKPEFLTAGGRALGPRAPRRQAGQPQKNWVTRALNRLQPRRERLQRPTRAQLMTIGQHIQAYMLTGRGSAVILLPQ